MTEKEGNTAELGSLNVDITLSARKMILNKFKSAAKKVKKLVHTIEDLHLTAAYVAIEQIGDFINDMIHVAMNEPMSPRLQRPMSLDEYADFCARLNGIDVEKKK